MILIDVNNSSLFREITPNELVTLLFALEHQIDKQDWMDFDSLRSKGLIDDYNVVTDKGLFVLSQFRSDPLEVSNLTLFEEFWRAYPTRDPISSRVIRTGKVSTKKEYSIHVHIKGVDEETILRALTNEVASRKANGTLKYMKSPLKWLRDQEYTNNENVAVYTSETIV